MVRRSLTFVIGLILLAPVLAAEEPALQVSQVDTVRAVLAKHTGERVTVKLDSGEELSGKVQSVGDHVAHLSELSGKEFYDAVIDLDEIAAVIIRVRGAR